MATPPDFVSGAVLTAAQMNAIGQWTVVTKTSFSAVANFGASGVFTSDFDDYLLVIRNTTSSTGSGGFQLTLASVPASSLYSRQALSASDTTLTGFRETAQANILAFLVPTNGSFAAVSTTYISRPALAESTMFINNTARSSGNFTSITMQQQVAMHETATAYDGFAINMPGGQTTTGDYILYGLNK
jgi:hypothetical protein